MIQVDSLRQRCELQEFELQKALKKTQEAISLASEESAKSKAAKEVIKCLTAQVIFCFRFTVFACGLNIATSEISFGFID